jgi:hypothetical protein
MNTDKVDNHMTSSPEAWERYDGWIGDGFDERRQSEYDANRELKLSLLPDDQSAGYDPRNHNGSKAT